MDIKYSIKKPRCQSYYRQKSLLAGFLFIAAYFGAVFPSIFRM
jgi:hypothetical protein